MKKLLYPMIVAAPLALVIVSCHKSNTNESITFLNIVGNYKVTSDIYSNGQQSINFFDSVDVCQKDDIFEFQKDSTFDYVDAGMVCVPNGSFSSTWSLTGTSLTISGNQSATVKSLTSKTLVLTTVDTTASPAITETLTLARQ
jgi:hypothetical protein